MTSLDRYQIIQIVFLAMCCVWHSTISSIMKDPNDYDRKVVVDRTALGAFALVFLLIQVVFTIMVWRSYLEIKKLQKRERAYLRSKKTHEDVIDSDDEM
jgi:hypothetical protein